jgi:hypothetical protein
MYRVLLELARLQDPKRSARRAWPDLVVKYTYFTSFLPLWIFAWSESFYSSSQHSLCSYWLNST